MCAYMWGQQWMRIENRENAQDRVIKKHVQKVESLKWEKNCAIGHWNVEDGKLKNKIYWTFTTFEDFCFR